MVLKLLCIQLCNCHHIVFHFNNKISQASIKRSDFWSQPKMSGYLQNNVRDPRSQDPDFLELFSGSGKFMRYPTTSWGGKLIAYMTAATPAWIHFLAKTSMIWSKIKAKLGPELRILVNNSTWHVITLIFYTHPTIIYNIYIKGKQYRTFI